MNKTGLIYIPTAFYCRMERKNRTIFMAEPQNLRFRQFQAFFGLEGKNSNKNKKYGQFFRLFLIIFQAKKMKIGPLLDFYGFLEQKRGKSKNGPIFTFNTAIESYGQMN